MKNYMQDESKKSSAQSGGSRILYKRESVDLSLTIAKDTLEILEEVARKRDLSVASLLKLFIGIGLRALEPEMSNELAVKRFRNRKGEQVDVPVDLAA